MGINWNYPTTMWIGENRIEDLSLACKELNISNPLFVTDKDLINLDLIKKRSPKHMHYTIYTNYKHGPNSIRPSATSCVHRPAAA